MNGINFQEWQSYTNWYKQKEMQDPYYMYNQYTNTMNFGQAIEALKEGKMVQRTGWNGKGLFVFMQVPSQINEEIIPKMHSLPQSVKDEFAKRGGDIYYLTQMALVNPNNIINGWIPSASDTLAEDWIIL